MTWDLSADVVVVGYGAAGTSTALEAVAAGADVLAIAGRAVAKGLIHAVE